MLRRIWVKVNDSRKGLQICTKHRFETVAKYVPYVELSLDAGGVIQQERKNVKQKFTFPVADGVNSVKNQAKTPSKGIANVREIGRTLDGVIVLPKRGTTDG